LNEFTTDTIPTRIEISSDTHSASRLPLHVDQQNHADPQSKMFKKERRFGALRAVLTPQVRIAIVVVIILVILCYALPVNTYLQNLMAWIDSLNIVLGAILFMTFYAFIVVSFLPSMVLSLAAGYLWGFGHALLVVVTGCTIGSALAFLLGKKVFYNSVVKLAEQYPKFKQIDNALGEKAWQLVILLRISPLIPYNVFNYAMALTSVDLWTFTWASAVGMIPQQSLCVYVGSVAKSLSDVFASDGDPTLIYVGIGVTIIIAIVVTLIVNNAVKKALANADTPDTEDLLAVQLEEV